MMFIYYYHANFTSLVIEKFIVPINQYCLHREKREAIF